MYSLLSQNIILLLSICNYIVASSIISMIINHPDIFFQSSFIPIRMNKFQITNPPSPSQRPFEGLASLFKLTVGNRFLSLFDQVVNTKPTIEQNQQEIANNFSKMNSIIDDIEMLLNKRFDNHEKQVFQIIQEEMKGINEEVRRLSKELNVKIQQRNSNEELWFLSNQLDFFKLEALKLFQINKEMRLQIKVLKKTIREYELELQNKQKALQNAVKKHLKEKSHRKAQNVQPKKSVRQNSTSNDQSVKKENEGKPKRRLLTQVREVVKTESKEGKEDQDSRININLSTDSFLQLPAYHPILLTVSDDFEKSVEKMPAFLNPLNQSERSKVLRVKDRFKNAQSFMLEEKPNVVDKQTQTKENNMIINSRRQEKEEQLCQVQKANKDSKNIDLLKSGFRMTSTHRKSKPSESIFRGSVQYEKKATGWIRSINYSLLKNRIEDNLFGRRKKSKTVLKRQSYYEG